MRRLPPKRYILCILGGICLTLLLELHRLGTQSEVNTDHCSPYSQQHLNFTFEFKQPNHINSNDDPLERVSSGRRTFYKATGDKISSTIPWYNRPQIRRRTPLLIGFDSRSDILEQTVMSYIAAGWPPSEILIVDNSGHFADERAAEEKRQPFDYARFRFRYGVGVLRTDTRLTFSQLQNFYLQIAHEETWPHYFWSHMDVAVLSNPATTPYQSFYQAATMEIEHLDDSTGFIFFHYDRLCLVHTKVVRERVGPWDVDIPYYPSDCDYYSRARNVFNIKDARKDFGYIFDVADVLPDYQKRFLLEKTASIEQDWIQLHSHLCELQSFKQSNPNGRNTWQAASQASKLAKAAMERTGRAVYFAKHGTNNCDPGKAGLFDRIRRSIKII